MMTHALSPIPLAPSGFRCPECGANVAPDHTPGDDACDAIRVERERGRRG